MVQCWYMGSSNMGQRFQHHREPPEYIKLEELQLETGVLYWKIDPNCPKDLEKLEKIKKDRGYTYSDIVEIAPQYLKNYEEKLKSFYVEHIHADEEIRHVLEGSGYFDVRDRKDQWIRISTKKGDLILLPAGIYHRFTLDTQNYIKAQRLFVGDPVWTPHNRPGADEMQERKDYVEEQKKDFPTLLPKSKQ